MMAGNSRTCAACLQMQDRLSKSAANGPCTMTCAYGLSETAVPVKLGEAAIGYLQTGQVMRQKPTGASFHRAVEQAKKLGVELDGEKARAAYFGTPVVPQRKMESISRLLSIFADHLSIRSNQIALQSANAEMPVITRARRFIEEHQAEDLSLGQVAAAVHSSKFYFCKIFKKAAGVSFTGYLSRVRTERAKNLLLNPNLRVSEIAYEVGFQSLTHFNRVFKRILGQSPTDYRGRLTAS
jgi:AraC-like DNA-binding protein